MDFLNQIYCGDCRRAGGFTLIELLIVVAIIAILAAIAVPNFLEAQVRSKVSRAASDMRTIATGLESYAVDHGRYPPNPSLNEAFYVTPVALTTPQAYIAAWPVDPFKVNRSVASGLGAASFADQEIYYDYYTILTWSQYAQTVERTGKDVFILAVDAPIANRNAIRKYGRWLQWSVGPDGEFWMAKDDFANPANASAGLKSPVHKPWGFSFDVPYDPSNGTKSFGNIICCQARSEGVQIVEP